MAIKPIRIIACGASQLVGRDSGGGDLDTHMGVRVWNKDAATPEFQTWDLSGAVQFGVPLVGISTVAFAPGDNNPVFHMAKRFAEEGARVEVVMNVEGGAAAEDWVSGANATFGTPYTPGGPYTFDGALATDLTAQLTAAWSDQVADYLIWGDGGANRAGGDHPLDHIQLEDKVRAIVGFLRALPQVGDDTLIIFCTTTSQSPGEHSDLNAFPLRVNLGVPGDALSGDGIWDIPNCTVCDVQHLPIIGGGDLHFTGLSSVRYGRMLHAAATLGEGPGIRAT